MSRSKRVRRERTHDWQQIEQYTLWPEQQAYELLRPIVLFGETAAERAKETGASERTLQHKADQFDHHGMASLFPKEHAPSPDKARSLPPDMRQLIVDLKAEHPGFRPNEIATICFLRFGRRPSPHSVQRVLADGPKTRVTARRYPAYAQIPDGYQRRRAIIDLHAEGWSITTMSAYLQTPRHRVYEVLKRWATEGHAGLEDKSRAPHHPARKVTIRDINEVKKLASNPDLGAYRVRAALLPDGDPALTGHLWQTPCSQSQTLRVRSFQRGEAQEERDAIQGQLLPPILVSRCPIHRKASPCKRQKTLLSD